jgi:tetratricopeptide (TPR) repeat protein
MLRPKLASACLLLAACNAPEARPGPAFREPPEQIGLPLGTLGGPSGNAPAPAAETDAPTEAELRDQLRSAADPTPAALQLARVLDAEERLPEALAVLDQALGRRPSDPLLEVARAGVLRDLGRRDQALAALRALLQRAGPAKLHPGLLYELAEIEFVEGETAAAKATLNSLRQEHADDPWLRGSAAELSLLQRQVDAGGRPVRLTSRDLLGNLRGAAAAAERARALEQLLPLGGLVAARAQAIAAADRAPEVRAAAVRQCVVDGAVLPEMIAVGLADPEPSVRRAAATRARELPAQQAIDLLLPTLAAEQDAETFAALNGALRASAGGGPELTAAAAADPAARSAAVSAWRSQWGK